MKFFITSWINLFYALDNSYRNTFIRTVRDELINTETEYANTINLFGNLLLNCELLEENADELMRDASTKSLTVKIQSKSCG